MRNIGQMTVNDRLPSLTVIQEIFNKIRCNELYKKKYSGLSLNTWDDFFNLPLTYKEDIRASGPEGMLAVPRDEAWHYHESFGTTGTPISTWFTADDYECEINQTWRWTSEIKPGMLVLNRFPYSFAVPPFILEQKCKRDGGIIVPAGYLSWNVSYPRILEIIKRLKIEAIGCLPSELIMLEMIAEKCGYDIKKDLGSLNHILMSGQIVPAALKEYIENRWDASVTSVYGSTETGGIASTCKEGSLHIHSDAIIVEILDPVTKATVNDGDIGVLVVTSYYRKAAPLFRYVTGDICRMVQEPCKCKDTTPVIQVLGRMDDVININNEKIYPYNLEQSILEFAKQFDSAVYFVIVTKKKLHIRIESHNGINKPTVDSLDELRKKLMVPLKVHVCRKGELLDVGFLLRSPEVYKPNKFSDWRTDPRKSITFTEALIKWPEIGFNEFRDIVQRFIKNAILRKIIR